MLADDVGRIALELVAAFEAAGLPCAIGGAMALATWAIPRSTHDIDLNVFVREDRYEEVVTVLERAGCRLDRGRALAQARSGEVMVAHKDEFRVDVFLPSIPFDWVSRDRVKRVTVAGRSVPILSAEAIAVYKLLFFRTKDLLDVANLISATRDSLDRGWIRSQLVDMLGDDSDRVQEWDRIVATHGPR